MVSNTILEEDKKYIMQVYSPEKIVIESAKGMYLIDTEGKAYLDFSAQFSSCSLGHGNEELIDAITQQMKKLVSVTSMFVTEERVELAKTLTDLAPKGLTKVLLGCTGSDANEFALKAAKYYRGGGKIFSFWRGFHGSTAGAAGATGKSETIQENTSISELLPRGFLHTSPPYCYRCDFGKEPSSCGFQCLQYLERQILHEGGDKVAAVITEPIFAAGGVIVPPDGYLEALRELCNKYNALLIFDEVVTGIGQTGTMFACEHWSVTPDILVTGKALTGGYVPGSAVIAKTDIGEAMDELTLHGHTHSFYPGMCAAASKNLEIIAREQLVGNSRVVGNYLNEKLNELKEKYSVIGEIRGMGLLQGIELVKDKNSKEAYFELGQLLFEEMLKNGLVTELESRRNLENVVIVLHPPLITSKTDIDLAINIIDKSIYSCLVKLKN
jgi:4-aminobutyrate aminotransferase-like enzyme